MVLRDQFTIEIIEPFFEKELLQQEEIIPFRAFPFLSFEELILLFTNNIAVPNKRSNRIKSNHIQAKMKIQMVHPSSSTINAAVNGKTRKMPKNKELVHDASTCEGPPAKATSSTSLQQDQVLKWIQSGIAVERKILARLLAVPTTDKSKDKANIETKKDEAFGPPNAKKEGEKTEGGNNGREEVKATITASNDKENIASIGPAEKLEIRLPFVDWKTILSKSVPTQACPVEEFEAMVSDIVQGWLCVLARLGQDDSPFFSSATSFRSQIYRRLTLLLVAFVGTIGPLSEGPPSEKDASARIVEHTLYLARKILKEGGSDMKKKKPNEASQTLRRKNIEADGLYYYCFFTAIAAECCELLDDHDRAMLAYKSIRAMQDRQQLSESNAGCVVVYTDHRMAPPVAAYGSPVATLTKTPANTPTRNPSSASKPSNDEWISFHANMSTSNRRSSLMLPLRDSLETINSKIGNDLVLPGTLEERILRCSGAN